MLQIDRTFYLSRGYLYESMGEIILNWHLQLLKLSDKCTFTETRVFFSAKTIIVIWYEQCNSSLESLTVCSASYMLSFYVYIHFSWVICFVVYHHDQRVQHDNYLPSLLLFPQHLKSWKVGGPIGPAWSQCLMSHHLSLFYYPLGLV